MLFTAFRIAAIVEGITTLALFFVAMPIKYMLHDPLWVQIVGPLHGYAFLLYIALMAVLMRKAPWTNADVVRASLASLIPFGTFLNDGAIKRRWQTAQAI